MKCPNCGRENLESSAFCTGCGAKLAAQCISAQPAPAYYAPAGNDGTKSLSMWDFFLMEFLAKIPIANLVLYLVWSFSGNINENRRHWSQAKLVWLAIRICFGVLTIVACAFFSAALFSSLDTVSNGLANIY